jgi:glycerophosphoryl diester phosphodiesterase
MQRTLILILTFASTTQLLFAESESTRYQKSFEIVAHRGVHHDYHRDGLNNQTCTATRIFKPTHEYLENTVESIQAAFDYGASIVEIDIRPTKDKQLVVFHDHFTWCRTEAPGLVIDYTVEELKQLDLGYGYTYDEGKTFPFRGKGVGKIKTLNEVLDIFPDKRFLIDNKSGNNLEVAQLIVDQLEGLPIERQRLLFLFSTEASYRFINKHLPAIRRLWLSKQQHRDFAWSYLLRLSLGDIPAQYHNHDVVVPMNLTTFLLGWPDRFIEKPHKANMRVYAKVDTPDEASEVMSLPIDGIVTNYIEIIGSMFKKGE